MNPLIATSGGTTLWYLSRASGIVSLVLLTASLLAGILTSLRWSNAEWPRFVIEFVHRNVSLLVLVFIGIHVATVVLDGFAPISWLDAVVPFRSAYRPLWLGVGAAAFDLIIALVVTSLVRHRIGFRSWRLVHWLAYACWPLAVVHGLGSGTDTNTGVSLIVTAACVLSVLVAAAVRAYRGLAARPAARTGALFVLAALPVALVVWLAAGPLAPGWARRAGTPASVLAAASRGGSPGAPTPSNGTRPAAPAGFRAQWAGTVSQGAPDSRGDVAVSMVGALQGTAGGTLDMELRGRPIPGGGLDNPGGSVTWRSGAGDYHGPVVFVEGPTVVADLTGPRGDTLRFQTRFTRLDPPPGQVAADVVTQPVGAGGGGGNQ